MVTEPAVKKGYKQTELGVIPEDWDVNRLGECCAKITDGTHDTPKPINEGVPFLTAIHIKEGHIDFDGCYYLPQSTHEIIYKRCNPQKDDVLMVNIGAGVATTALVKVNYEFSLKNVALLKPNRNILAGPYLNYFQEFVKNNIVASLSSGGAQPFLSLGQIGELLIALPTKAEQVAIAAVLSDTDALIESLDKLIAKKKAIKQGAMQQLLTGKKRLQSFSDPWRTTTLGEIIDVLTDFTANGSFESLRNNVTYYSERNYAVLVRTTDLDKSEFVPERFTDEKGYRFLAKTALFGGEIILANVGSLGKVFRVPRYQMPMTLAPNTYVLKFKNCVSEDYIYQWLKTNEFYNRLMSKIGSTTLQAINKGNLRSIETVLPTDVKEQSAIAAILVDMDKGIDQLEQKRNKYAMLKQGMMQQLLTGKIRIYANN